MRNVINPPLPAVSHLSAPELTPSPSFGRSLWTSRGVFYVTVVGVEVLTETLFCAVVVPVTK